MSYGVCKGGLWRCAQWVWCCLSCSYLSCSWSGLGKRGILLSEAFSLEWTCFFGIAVVFLSSFLFFCCAKDLLIVWRDDVGHIRHAVVTDFEVLLIENFTELVVLRKIFIEKSEKFLGYVCLYVPAIRRVEPDNALLSFFFPLASRSLLHKLNSMNFSYSLAFSAFL